tara:strand:+ start:314 stop:565 length:252 start_codon:yes stop_codon:yes gene_type:complete
MNATETTHTVLVQVTLTIEVTVEAGSRADAARLAKTFELDDVQLSGTVSTASGPLHGSNYNIDGVDTQWVEFDQRTRVVEVTS